jgi:hypothetical protein
MPRRTPAAALLVLLSAACALPALGDDRNFTFVRETSTLPKGGKEYEQWVTYKARTNEDHDFKELEFKHEFEYGLTDRANLGLDLEWHASDGDERDQPRFDVLGIEMKYRFWDQGVDPIGAAVFVEIEAGPEVAGAEVQLILDTHFGDGKWFAAYNFIAEAETEGEHWNWGEEDGGEFGNRLAVGYELTDKWRLGGELVHEIPLPDWHSGENQNVFLGPVASYHGGGWAITGTALIQATDNDDEPRYMFRLIAEIDF